MSRLDDSVKAAGGFWDLPETLAAPLKDPLERAAILAFEQTYNTPEAAIGSLGLAKSRNAAVARWVAQPKATRHLYRRRVAGLLEVAQREPKGA